MISIAELRGSQRPLDFGSDNAQTCVPLTDTFLFTVKLYLLLRKKFQTFTVITELRVRY